MMKRQLILDIFKDHGIDLHSDRSRDNKFVTGFSAPQTVFYCFDDEDLEVTLRNGDVQVDYKDNYCSVPTIKNENIEELSKTIFFIVYQYRRWKKEEDKEI